MTFMTKAPLLMLEALRRTAPTGPGKGKRTPSGKRLAPAEVAYTVPAAPCALLTPIHSGFDDCITSSSVYWRLKVPELVLEFGVTDTVAGEPFDQSRLTAREKPEDETVTEVIGISAS